MFAHVFPVCQRLLCTVEDIEKTPLSIFSKLIHVVLESFKDLDSKLCSQAKVQLQLLNISSLSLPVTQILLRALENCRHLISKVDVHVKQYILSKSCFLLRILK